MGEEGLESDFCTLCNGILAIQELLQPRLSDIHSFVYMAWDKHSITLAGQPEQGP